MAIPKVATDWLGACAGCHMSLLDADEGLLDLLAAVQLTSCPITDLKHPPEEGVEVGVLTGALTNTSNVEVALTMRERCGCLVALGDCAVFGGIPAMRNAFSLEEALQRAYVETESTVDGFVPQSPELARPIRCRPVSALVDVDISLPGCPPSPEAIVAALSALAAGVTPVVEGEILKYD
jgi:NAD-reducing hydrogenase small subunit